MKVVALAQTKKGETSMDKNTLHKMDQQADEAIANW
jgi:hypothetical protein